MWKIYGSFLLAGKKNRINVQKWQNGEELRVKRNQRLYGVS